jgi:hypothetical protein
VKPCESGCGTGATITITARKARDRAITSSVNHRPRVATLRLNHASFDAPPVQSDFSRSHIPRGPPTLFSF